MMGMFKYLKMHLNTYHNKWLISLPKWVNMPKTLTMVFGVWNKINILKNQLIKFNKSNIKNGKVGLMIKIILKLKILMIKLKIY